MTVLAGFEFRGHEGERIVVVGESLFSPGYVDVLVDGRPSCRPLGLVLRRMGLDVDAYKHERKEAAMAATTSQRKARPARRAKEPEAATPDARRAKLDHACEVLGKLLADGEWVRSSEVHARAAKLGVSDSLMGQAKKALGISHKRDERVFWWKLDTAK